MQFYRIKHFNIRFDKFNMALFWIKYNFQLKMFKLPLQNNLSSNLNRKDYNIIIFINNLYLFNI